MYRFRVGKYIRMKHTHNSGSMETVAIGLAAVTRSNCKFIARAVGFLETTVASESLTIAL